MQPQGVLYVSFNKVPTGYTFSEVTALQSFSNGSIRQVAVYQNSKLFSTSDVSALNSIASTLEQQYYQPLSVLYTANFGTGSTSTYTNVSTLNSGFVSVVIGQDLGGTGYSLFTGLTSTSTTGATVSNIGSVLGSVSFAQVSDNIGWVGKFNLDGTNLFYGTLENDSIGFIDGSLYRTYSPSALSALDANGYIFMNKQVGYVGSFNSSDNTCTSSSSSYDSIHNNRTIDKAIRTLRVAYAPYLNSPLNFNGDGTLTSDTISAFESLGEDALQINMQSNNEISDLSVTIDPSQNVLSTGNLSISMSIIPIGCATTITVNIGFVTSIS